MAAVPVRGRIVEGDVFEGGNQGGGVEALGLRVDGHQLVEEGKEGAEGVALQ